MLRLIIKNVPLLIGILCLPKQLGGLGLRHLDQLNTAFLMKLGWNLLTNPNSLWGQVVQAKYFPNQHLLCTSPKQSNSWGWKSICRTLSLIRESVFFSLGSGEHINFWFSKWLGDTTIAEVSPHIPSHLVNLTLNQLIS